ncbi:MAG: hypothetical protein PVI21_05790 [Candidatus Woesebacteria bacterium]|jgi:hypothetical protein
MGWLTAAGHVIRFAGALFGGGDPGEVEFTDDGTTQSNPMWDNDGKVYKTRSDYLTGNNPYTVDNGRVS